MRVLAGSLRDAWLAYPRDRRRILSIPSGKPIFLTGTHRSGTTWLAAMLAASGIWYIHEPFNRNKGRWPGAFAYRSVDIADSETDRLFSDVLAGGFRSALHHSHASHALTPLRLLPIRPNRIFIKDPLACLLTEYLTTRFDLKTLMLFRHPGGVCSSLMRLNWPTAKFLRQFLSDEALMIRFFHPFRDIMSRYAGSDSVASAAVLHGALTHANWQITTTGLAEPLYFERFCADPLNELSALFERLGLPYTAETRVFHKSACFGTGPDPERYSTHAVVRNSIAMADAWKGRFDAGEIATIRGLWSEFGVPLYLDDESWH